MARLAVELDRVPETLLWTLYHRAIEARRPDPVLRDPLAVDLVEQIEFPFEERFGSGAAFSQWQALRARCFDGAVNRFLAEKPGGTVVALGEGLETQFWRVDNGRVRWLTVDLPEVVDLRQPALPEEPRVRAIGCSALDPRWLAEVQDEAGVLVTAQGLLMYLAPDEARGLVARCAERFARRRSRLRRRAALARRAKPTRPPEDVDRLRAAAVVLGVRPGRGAAAAGATARRRPAGAPPPARTRSPPRRGAPGSRQSGRTAAGAAVSARRSLRAALDVAGEGVAGGRVADCRSRRGTTSRAARRCRA